MELHVLGPAFGLPSIDAECVAAIALLQLVAPKGWQLVPSHDRTLRVPYLVDGEQTLQGFKSIAHHVERLKPNQHSPFDDTSLADSVAISSFVQTSAQTLLDISLYVSHQNYSVTRSAFTKILPWYANYVIPPRRRADAKKRTEHLGISNIDVDDVHEDLSNRPATFDVGKEQKFEADTQKRASLLLPRKDTVRSLLSRPEHSGIFKLHTLADNFFGPLQDLLGSKKYFLQSYEPSSVDCLVYGYLSLMLYSTLPQDWLAKTMRRKYSTLVAFTERLHQRLRMKTSAEEVVRLMNRKRVTAEEQRGTAEELALPWAVPPSSSGYDITRTIYNDLAARIPTIGISRVQAHSATPQATSIWTSKYLSAALTVTATSIGLLVYYAFTLDVLTWPRGENVHVYGRKRFSDYGHLGAALAGMSFMAQQAPNEATFHPTDRHDQPPRVEVEVDGDFQR